MPSRVNLKCPPLLEDELLVSVAKKYKKTTAQVALRFNVQRGVVVIPKSFNHVRIKENFQVGLALILHCLRGFFVFFAASPHSLLSTLQIFDFSLTDAEMKAIEGLNKNIRFVELLM